MNISNKFIISRILLISYAIYLFSVFMLLDSLFIDSSSPKIYLLISLVIIFILSYIFIIFNKRKSVIESIIFLITLISILISFLMGNESIVINVCIIVLFVLNSNLTSFKQLITTDFFTRSISILCVILFDLLKVFPSTDTIQNNMSIINHAGNGFRYSLGFFHPNELGVAVLSLFISGLLCSLFLNKAHKKIILFIIFLFIYLFIYKVSESREFLISGVIILLSLLFYKSNSFNKLCKFLSYISVILSISISLFNIMITNTSSAVYHLLNQLFSSRLIYQNEAVKLYPPKLFGYSGSLIDPSTVFDVGGPKEFSIDNAYIRFLLSFGIIGLIIYLLVLVYLFKMLNFIDINIFYVLIITLSFCAIAEYSYDLLFVFIFIFSYYFNDKRNSNKKVRCYKKS